MFDFLFRRQAKPKETPPVETRVISERAAQKLDARQVALMQADALAGDESAAVTFILGCAFADARLKAAASVHSRSALEQVRSAMLNVDRRVAKLMQARLDVLKQNEKSEQAALACIDAAVQLTREIHLAPSQVADLDRNWQSLGEISADKRNAFTVARAEIDERLSAQMALQRTVMDALARLRQIASSPEEMAADDLARVLDGLAAEIAECVNSRELPSLPRSLLPAFEEEFRKLKNLQDAYEQRRQALAGRLEAIERWESASPESLDRNEIERIWRSLPYLSEDDLTPLQSRLDALLGRVSGREKQKPAPKEARKAAGTKPEFADGLYAMEKALQEGSLQLAAEHDEALRALVSGKEDIDRAMAERLSQARSELKRLQEWARWSGRVSREELIRSVEELPALSLSMDDLANRVIEARKTWKKLDGVSGAAPKSLWEQFDAVCNAAYAPVGERNRRMAVERARNAESAQALIAQVREFAASFDIAQSEGEAVIDWKGAASFYRRARQSWTQIGAIERKERKRLDAEFEQAISVLQQPLEQQWQMEAARREQLIDAIRALDPKSRGAVDAVRRIQEQWQDSARSMPLGKREEQDLWKRFRNACDTLFAQRKESSDAADENRRRNLLAKEALCMKIEAALDEPVKSIPDLLAEVGAAWNEIGPEPSSDQGIVQKRYRSAVSALKARLEAAESAEHLANHQTLVEKLALCHAAEAALAGMVDADVNGWNLHWQVLPQLKSDQETVLRSRFDAAIAALEEGDSLYASMLEANHAQLLEELLRFEIQFGLESPQEFSAERLMMQVEVLQDSLAGNKSLPSGERMEILFSLPALTDKQTAARIADVLHAAFAAGH